MSFFSKLFSFLSKKKKRTKIIFCGLDNAGKSTILNYLKPKKHQKLAKDITPTVGYTTELFSLNSLDFEAFDMSGGSKYRNFWEELVQSASAVIFVIDSCDLVRLAIATNELLGLLEKDVDSELPVLFFANKMDLNGAVGASEISDKMELHKLKNSWTIVASNALKGVGIEEGFKWLSDTMEKKAKGSKKK